METTGCFKGGKQIPVISKNKIDKKWRWQYDNSVLIVLVQLERRERVILIDYSDRRPIYEQIIDRFEQLILCGALEADSPMPSVRSLAMELSINPNTIQRAYQELERNGFIYAVKGKGSFVCDTRQITGKKQEEARLELKRCLEKAKVTGLEEEEVIRIVHEVMNSNSMSK